MAKASGITLSVNKKTGDERSQRPSGHTAEDYNRLRQETLAAFPVLAPLLPPAVDTYEGGNGTRWSHQSWSEIDAFAEQIYQMLDAQTE